MPERKDGNNKTAQSFLICPKLILLLTVLEKQLPPPATFAQQAIHYLLSLCPTEILPPSVEVINPYQRAEVQETVRQFYTRFFDDQQPRVFLLGINPGRLGGGITGIPFTDPVALQQHCGIAHEWSATRELSSRFVYAFIERMGGAPAFYARFYLTALYPLALVRHGKNYNFYDEPALFTTLKPAIVENIKAQLEFGANRKHAVCLGRKNGDYLEKLNRKHHFFDSLIVLDHPRYIMQYKLRQLDDYLNQYQEILTKLVD